MTEAKNEEKLREIIKMLETELNSQAHLDEVMEVLESAVKNDDVFNSEGGLVVLAVKLYRSSHPKFYMPKLQTAIETLNSVISDLSVTPKTFTEAKAEVRKSLFDEPPTEPMPTYEQPPSKTDELKELVKERKKRGKYKTRIVGTRLTGSIAKKIEKKYATKLIVERYQQVLKAMKEKNVELLRGELAKITGLPENSVYAHLRFGIERGDVKTERRQFIITTQGKESCSFMERGMNLPEYLPNAVRQPVETAEPEKEFKKKTTEYKKAEGTHLDDAVAKELSSKRGYMPLVKERLNRIMHLLGQHVGYWATAEEMTELSGLPKHSVKLHLDYAVLTKVAVYEKKRYITKANYDRIPKNVVRAETRSFVKDLNKEPEHDVA